MVRISRIKFTDPEEGYYHVISRTIHQDFLLGETEKEYFLKLLKKLSRVYFVRLATFTVMANHFHLVLQMVPSSKISDEELQQRFDLYYNEGLPQRKYRPLLKEDCEKYRARYSDLSRFVQDLKQRFSRWYNRENRVYGHFWADRFKSVILESSRALLACLIYVELNAIRAGIVECPEDYRFCGLHHYAAGGRIARWLDSSCLEEALASLYESPEFYSRDTIVQYLRVIYEKGLEVKEGKASIDDNVGVYALQTDFANWGVLSFKRRIRYFSDGVMLGSKLFCEEKFREFRSYFQTNRDRTGKLIKGKQKKKRRAAPEGHLLHLHSIRAFVQLDR